MPDLTEAELGALRGLLRSVQSDRFAGSTLRGGLPNIPTTDALPDADLYPVGSFVIVLGPPDVAYVLLRDVTGVSGWEVAATG